MAKAHGDRHHTDRMTESALRRVRSVAFSMSAKHNDGTVETFVAGDVYVIEPGHDGWVEGDTECVALEFNATAAKTYAAKN